jgi:outer membrane protein assembly factor BamB
VASEGTVYAGAGNLYAVKPVGSLKWSFPAGVGNSAPAIGFDGTTFCRGANGNLFSVSSGGAQTWTFATGSQNWPSSASIGHNGTIYIPSPDVGVFYALNPDGTLKWQFAFLDGVRSGDSATIAADGTIYVSGGWTLYALSPDGTNLWSYRTNGFIGTSPVIGKDGTIYLTGAELDNPVFGWNHMVLHALSPAGSLKWRFNPPANGPRHIPGSPAVDSAGTIYYAGFTTLYAVSSDGQEQWKFDSGGDSFDPNAFAYTSPAIATDGTIYVTFGSRLYAIAGTNGPADSPWPMYRQNARRTGKVEKPALRQPQKRSDANFQFQLYGQLGQTFTVEASTNFNTWTSVTSFVANTLPMDVVDLSASNHPSRFYRASSPP